MDISTTVRSIVETSVVGGLGFIVFPTTVEEVIDCFTNGASVAYVRSRS